MAKFEYITKTGSKKTFEAADAQAALKSMPSDAAKTSGVSVFKDTSATKTKDKSKKDGITLPDADIPNLGGRSQNKQNDINSLLSASAPAVNVKDLERQNERLRKSSASAIEGRYGATIEETRQQGAQETRATEGALGTGRRFSSSAQAFVKFLQTENDKKVQEYTRQMESALAENDIVFAEKLTKRIAEERQAQQQEFENMFKILNYQKELEKYEAEKNKPFVTASREAAIADLYSQGITDPGQILQFINFTDAGEQIGDITLDEISGVLENISGGGMAEVVFNNPILFSKLPSSQISEITPKLAEMGFDFKAAIDIAARKNISRSSSEVTTIERPVTFDEFIATPEAQQYLSDLESSEMMTLSPQKRQEALNQRYEELSSNDQLPTLTDTKKKSKSNYSATNIPNNVKIQLLDDIENGGYTKAELYRAYPEVSTSYINSLVNSYSVKKGGSADDPLDF